MGGASSETRGICMGGSTNPSGAATNIDFITIASTGAAKDFGDMNTGRKICIWRISDSHGGLNNEFKLLA